MTFSQRAIEAAAAHVLRELDDRGLLKGVDDDLFSEIGNDVAKAALTAALTVDVVALVPKEPTRESLDALSVACRETWGVNVEQKRPAPFLTSEWRERMRPIYQAAISPQHLKGRSGSE